jgi:hypothetical protein
VTVGLSGLALPPRARVDLGDLGVLRAAARRDALSQGLHRAGASAVLERHRTQGLTVESMADRMRASVGRTYRRDPDLIAAELAHRAQGRSTNG